MYQILKILSKLTLTAYFRKIKIEGKENIPKKGPIVFIANHPSAFMDPLIVATTVKQSVHFLAAGEYMGKGFKYWFMHNFLHMIPVYRPSTLPNEVHKNSQVFDKCITHLSSGRCMLVFPEGISITEKKVNPLKTGVARIVRATEMANELKTGVHIVPVGLNYSDPHTFRSDLYVQIGKPILASTFFTTSTDREKEIEEVKNLTQHMEDELINTVLHIENMEFEEVLDKINSTFTAEIKSDLGVGFSDQEREFQISRLIASAIVYFKQHKPNDYTELKTELDEYLGKLNTIHTSDRELRKVDQGQKPGHWFFLLWGAPVFIPGFFSNVIPYMLTTRVKESLNVKSSFSGSITLGVGMAIFLLWYIGVTLALFFFTPLGWWSLLAPVVMYTTGLFASVYRDVVLHMMKRRKVRVYLNKNAALKNELLGMRKKLMEKFERARQEFKSKMGIQ